VIVHLHAPEKFFNIPQNKKQYSWLGFNVTKFISDQIGPHDWIPIGLACEITENAIENGQAVYSVLVRGESKPRYINISNTLRAKFPEALQASKKALEISEGVYKVRVHRVFGLFWPLFDSKIEGQYRQKYIAPHILDRKSTQKNRKIDRTSHCRHPLNSAR